MTLKNLQPELVRRLIGYALVALLSAFITFQTTRPSLAQGATGPLHIAATDCITQPTMDKGGDVAAGFAGVHVIAYVGGGACAATGLVRYVVMYQN